MRQTDLTFRPYDQGDHGACMALFDANSPEFFAPNERADYQTYLTKVGQDYEVGLFSGTVVAAFGLNDESDRVALHWILVDPNCHGSGVGSSIMQRVAAKARERSVTLIHIAASQKSGPFFAKFGAIAKSTEPEGWGPGLDRVNMEWSL